MGRGRTYSQARRVLEMVALLWERGANGTE
jgi:hypothetical protein